MGWTVGYRPPPESDLVNEILLSAGKALYLANIFESKCSYILRVAHLADVIENDSVVTLTQAISLLPSGKMLGGTLQEIFTRTDIGAHQEEVALLERARLARNYIAHEGAGAIGDLWSYGIQHKLHALHKLHAKVIDLAKGDDIVSAWVYEIEEPREPLPSIIDYPGRVVSWVFGHMPPEWLDIDWKPNNRRPRTVIDALSYEPWYSRPCKCLHDAEGELWILMGSSASSLKGHVSVSQVSRESRVLVPEAHSPDDSDRPSGRTILVAI